MFKPSIEVIDETELSQPEQSEQPEQPELLEQPEIQDMSEGALDGKLGEIYSKRLFRFPRGFGWLSLLTVAGAMIPKTLTTGVVYKKGCAPDERAIRTNLYTCLVGGPHTGKSTCIAQTIVALGITEPILFEGKLGSGEGMIRILNQHGGDGGNVLVSCDELKNTLDKANIQNSSLPTVLTTAWDKDSDMNVTKDTKLEYRARMSLVGGIPTDTFETSFGQGSIGGLYDRFLFAHVPDGYTCLYRPPTTTISETHPVPVEVDDDVWEWRDEWIGTNKKVSPRVIQNAMRASYICACFDNRRLQAKDLNPAVALAAYQAKMRELLAPNIGQTLNAKMELAILSYLKRHPGKWVPDSKVKDSVHIYRDSLGRGVYKSAVEALVNDKEVLSKGDGIYKWYQVKEQL